MRRHVGFASLSLLLIHFFQQLEVDANVEAPPTREAGARALQFPRPSVKRNNSLCWMDGGAGLRFPRASV
jgi:hypothetical protein